jgi:hypothetical protein
VIVPEKVEKEVWPVESTTSPPVILPPLKPTSESGIVVVNFKITCNVLTPTLTTHSPEKGLDAKMSAKAVRPGNVTFTLLTVPFVTSTASVPSKIP